MTSIKDLNPFRPGFGHLPPYLAGREDEQDQFRNKLADISASRSPAGATVLYGPRGMGKTVLLRWFENEVEKGGAKDDSIRIIWMTPNKLKSTTDLWKCLLPPKAWKHNFIPKAVTAGFNAILTATVTFRLHGSAKEVLHNTLVSECKERPLIFLMDEAHKMDAGLCNDLLNLYQEVSTEMPFMLVLAGTPGLRHLLSTVNATFVERSNKISIGCLDVQASADAIIKPLEKHGIQITDDALSLVVEDSQCYPYFIQEWGDSLWKEAKKASLTCLTDEQVAVVKPNIAIIKQDFYEERRDTLDELGLQSTAVAIAEVFQETKTMTKDRIKEVITDNLSADSLNTQSVIERLQTFVEQDFIWRSRGSVLYEPGIPNFMTHVINQQALLVETKSNQKVDKLRSAGGNQDNDIGL